MRDLAMDSVDHKPRFLPSGRILILESRGLVDLFYQNAEERYDEEQGIHFLVTFPPSEDV